MTKGIPARFLSAAALLFALLATVFSSSPNGRSIQIIGSGDRDTNLGPMRLTIRASSDGTGTNGQATFVVLTDNSKMKIDITGIEIQTTNRIAVMTGTVTSSNVSFFPFPSLDTVTFYVEDGGSGADSIPDGFLYPTEKLDANRNDGGTYPAVVHGNFIVKGAVAGP
jgi:hypothetical protein